MIIELSRPEAGWCQLEGQERYMRMVNACGGDEKEISTIPPLETYSNHVKAEYAVAKVLGFISPKQPIVDMKLYRLVRTWQTKDAPLLIPLTQRDEAIISYVRQLQPRIMEVVGWTTVANVVQNGHRAKSRDQIDVLAIADKFLFGFESFPIDLTGLNVFPRRKES